MEFLLKKIKSFLRSEILVFSKENLNKSIEALKNEIKKIDIEISSLKAKKEVIREQLASMKRKTF